MLRIIEEIEPAFIFAENSPNLRTRGLGVVVKGLTALGYVGCHGVLGAWHLGAPHKRNRMWIVACHPDCYNKSAMSFDEKTQRVPKLLATDTSSIKLRQQSRGCSRADRKNSTEFKYPRENLGNTTRERRSSTVQLRQQRAPKLVTHGDKERQHGRPGESENAARERQFTNKNWWEVEPPVGRVVNGLDRRVDRLKALGNGQVPIVAATAWQILSQSLLKKNVKKC
jgi:DNA (cytosine-5)-methyltransferase 1